MRGQRPDRRAAAGDTRLGAAGVSKPAADTSQQAEARDGPRTAPADCKPVDPRR